MQKKYFCLLESNPAFQEKLYDEEPRSPTKLGHTVMDALRLSWACHLSYGKLYRLWSDFKISKFPQSPAKLELFLDAFKSKHFSTANH